MWLRTERKLQTHFKEGRVLGKRDLRTWPDALFLTRLYEGRQSIDLTWRSFYLEIL
jgi:hypothetical protein